MPIKYPEPSKRLLRSGTTTVGIVCTDGVVLGTDTRATAGYFIAHKHVRKIFKIDDYVAATMSGVVAEAQKVLETAQLAVRLYKSETGMRMSIKAIATYISNILFSSRLFPYVIHTIVAGVDEQGPNMYMIDWFGSLTKERYIATGSGSPIALGVLEDNYYEGISLKEAIPIVIRAINSAIRRDPGSGEGIDVVYITKDKYVELPKSEILNILKTKVKKGS